MAFPSVFLSRENGLIKGFLVVLNKAVINTLIINALKKLYKPLTRTFWVARSSKTSLACIRDTFAIYIKRHEFLT